MPCQARHGPTRLRKDPAHHEPGQRFVAGPSPRRKRKLTTSTSAGPPGEQSRCSSHPRGTGEPLGLQVGAPDREGKCFTPPRMYQ
jgi:hypothetical protein